MSAQGETAMDTELPTPGPANEPVLDYAPGSPERGELIKKLAELKSRAVDIPLIIGGKEVRTGRTAANRSIFVPGTRSMSP